MRRFSQIDLSLLPEPSVIEPLDFETIRLQLLNAFIGYYPEFDMAAIEADPINKLLEVCAYRILAERARVNDAAKQVMLPYAPGTNLDVLASLFEVLRPDIVPADLTAGTPAVKMTDEAFRQLVQISIQAYSSAGPYGAYRYFALQSNSNVVDVNVVGPESGLVNAGQVGIYVLSSEAGGVPSIGTLNAVSVACKDPTVRPLTDEVLIAAATIVPYVIDVTIYGVQGPDQQLMIDAATEALTAYETGRRQVGSKVYRAGLTAAAFLPSITSGNVTFSNPIANVVINSPPLDVDPGLNGVAYAEPSAIVVTYVQAT